MDLTLSDETLKTSNPEAFPKLDSEELALMRTLSESTFFSDGQFVFRAGDVDLDLFIVESGAIEILNPADENCHVVTHGPGQFAGDIDLLTRRPVIVSCVARGPTQLLRVPAARLREILSKVPRLAEKFLIAIQERRRLLTATGVIGLKVVGPGKCRDTNLVREFLFKNFVPFTWYDSDSERGKKLLQGWGSPQKTPAIECSDGTLLINPELHELARCIGVWRHCPTENVDLAIIGAGPAGMTAAVYGSSEGLTTVVLTPLAPEVKLRHLPKSKILLGFPADFLALNSRLAASCRC